MPQVDGSATAATVSKVVVEKRPFPSTNSNVAELANRSVPKKKSSACSPGPIVSGVDRELQLAVGELRNFRESCIIEPGLWSSN